MPKVLTKLRIDEVASVDRGAGKDVHVKLIKARKPPFGEKGAKPFGQKPEDDGAADDVGKKSVKAGNPNLKGNDEVLNSGGGSADGGGDGYDGSSDIADDINKLEPYWKRDFTTEQRRAMAHNGQAMPGGGYPIKNRKNVKDAVRAIGRAKKPNKTKEHIMNRAQSLGHTDLIPDKWMMKSIGKNFGYIVEALAKSDGGEDFNTEMSEMRSLSFGEGLMEALHEAGHAMKHSIESIMEDGGTVDKGAAIRESFGQFLDHVKTLCPEGDVAKVAERAKERIMNFNKTIHTSVDQNDKTNRSAEIRGKGKTVTIDSEGDGDEQVDDKDNKEIGATAGTNDKASFKNKVWKGRVDAVLSMDKAHADYLRHPDNLMDRVEVLEFVDMGKADRAKFIEENPIGKMTEKRMLDLPEPLRKQLEAGARAAETLAKREEAELLTSMTKRAVDSGLKDEGVAGALVKLSKVDGESIEVVLKAIETMAKAVKAQDRSSVIFTEFGTNKGVDVSSQSAYDQLMTKAEAYQADMEKVGKAVTIEQAYSHIVEKRENSELFQMAKREGSVAA